MPNATVCRTRPRALAMLSLMLAGCSSLQAPAVEAIQREEVIEVLTAQAEQWNAGNLEAFVATYWDGPELTFYGKSGLARGRRDLLATYRRNYPTAKERGHLAFEVVDFRGLHGGNALLLGEYRIDGEVPSHGVFTLVLTRQHGRVVILHDHTTGT